MILRDRMIHKQIPEVGTGNGIPTVYKTNLSNRLWSGTHPPFSVLADKDSVR